MGDTFYTDHWRDIEDDRIARYEQMFQWRDGQAVLLEGAELAPGQRVLDLGSGPGFFAAALAERVGSTGAVDGADINAQFVKSANARAADQPNLNFHHVTDHMLPFDEGRFDRVIMKNVLEYVPDLAATLQEAHRVTAPGGKAHVIDSDWGFVLVEPWGPDRTRQFFSAAGAAFREPLIGRRAPAALQAAGFAMPNVRINTHADQKGMGLNVLTNMAGYIRTFGTMAEDEVNAWLDEAQDAVSAGRFLFCLPQFLITADKPE